ncbi:MAG: hypothetical protein CMF62_04115 [Magnetococcales bacterium]|nr:hypothetical protein [Magnetococcales bacterium]|tara:strand:- start:17263 stop:17604 length:342 start_codon:yes stop_codon:yes gene_type:complete
MFELLSSLHNEIENEKQLKYYGYISDYERKIVKELNIKGLNELVIEGDELHNKGDEYHSAGKHRQVQEYLKIDRKLNNHKLKKCRSSYKINSDIIHTYDLRKKKLRPQKIDIY